MYKTILFSGLLLAVAFGGPITMFRFSDFWKDLRQGLAGGKTATASSDSNNADKSAELVTSSLYGKTLSLEGAPSPGIAEVLRFDVSPAWVLQRWPRVSTDLARMQLHGYRVPLVTGTTPADMAGSLTYYFNTSQQVQQITFKGTTGDPRKLISFLNSRYGYVRRPNNDPSRLVFETVDSSGKTTGTMIVQSAPVVRSYVPYQRYAVDLTMDRQ